MRIKKISFGVVLLTLTVVACFPLKKMDLCTCGNQPINTSLQMNGVFMNTKGLDDNSYESFLLYKNGYLLDVGYIDNIKEAEYYVNLNVGAGGKGRWGCFSVIDSTIRMQYFYELHGGKFGLMESRGKILSEHSFVITKSINHHKKVFVEQDTFLLRPFAKPDSTNWLQKEKCKE